MIHFAILATVVAFIGLCWVTDVRERRIPNVLTGSAMLAGIFLNILNFGSSGLVSSLAGLLVAAGVLFVPFALGGIGAGDLKMMAAVGALLGPRLALTSLVTGMILGGAIMVVHLARQGRLGEKLSATGTMFASAAATRSLSPLKVSVADQGAIALPYSVPLGLGTLAVLALKGSLGVP